MTKCEDIKRLRAAGKSYSEIVLATGYSKALVSYYLNPERKDKNLDYQRERRTWLTAFLEGYKAEFGCRNCPEDDPVALDFHHRDPTTKIFTIGSKAIANKYSVERLMEEIEKCDILCANCHRKEHRKIKTA